MAQSVAGLSRMYKALDLILSTTTSQECCDNWNPSPGKVEAGKPESPGLFAQKRRDGGRDRARKFQPQEEHRLQLGVRRGEREGRRWCGKGGRACGPDPAPDPSKAPRCAVVVFGAAGARFVDIWKCVFGASHSCVNTVCSVTSGEERLPHCLEALLHHLLIFL